MGIKAALILNTLGKVTDPSKPQQIYRERKSSQSYRFKEMKSRVPSTYWILRESCGCRRHFHYHGHHPRSNNTEFKEVTEWTRPMLARAMGKPFREKHICCASSVCPQTACRSLISMQTEQRILS